MLFLRIIVVLLISGVTTNSFQFSSPCNRGHIRLRMVQTPDSNVNTDSNPNPSSPRRILSPKALAHVTVSRQNRAKAKSNKERTESPTQRKVRIVKAFKLQQRTSKKADKVKRLTLFSSRIPLSEIPLETLIPGRVITLVSFGAYIDIGTEFDGLLHIKDIDSSKFISHPREVLERGQDVMVRVKYIDVERRKLALTGEKSNQSPSNSYAGVDQEVDSRVELEDIEESDELWGTILKITNFGAFVDVGCKVEGFLHFMDHPDFPVMDGEHPSEFMSRGQRVKVYAREVDYERKRIKLTGNRNEVDRPTLSRSGEFARNIIL